MFSISFTMEFGDQSSRYPEPIDWETFKASFLPSDEEVCSICVTEGLSRQIEQDDKELLFVVNPKQFSLVTNSVIPIKKYCIEKEEKTYATDCGIQSMAVDSNDLDTTHCIKVVRNQQEVNDKFAFTPIYKQVPTGLWGNPRVTGSGGTERVLPPNANDDQFVKNTLSRFQACPEKPSRTQSYRFHLHPRIAIQCYSCEKRSL